MAFLTAEEGITFFGVPASALIVKVYAKLWGGLM